MKLPDAPVLRELNRDDESERNLVLSGWLRTFVGTPEKPSSVRLNIDRCVLIRLYQPLLKDLLARCHVVLATDAAAGFVYGWVAFEGDVLHYACIKNKWQRLGIGSWLLRDFVGMSAKFTHMTADGEKLLAKLNPTEPWTYAPMARFQEAA